MTGYNTGFYNLPSNFPADAKNLQGSDLVNAGRSLKNLWKVEKGTAMPDQRLTITSNGNFLSATSRWAISRHSVTPIVMPPTRWIEETIRKAHPTIYIADRQYNQQVRTGLLFNWAFKFNANHVIEFKNCITSVQMINMWVASDSQQECTERWTGQWLVWQSLSGNLFRSVDG